MNDMGNAFQFITAGIILLLAIITDRCFKDPAVKKSKFSPHKLFFVIFIYFLALIMVIYWSWLASQGVESSELAGSYKDILPQLGLIIIIFIILLVIEKGKMNSFGFCLPKNWRALIPPFIFLFSISLLNISWAHEVRVRVLVGGTILVITEEIVFRGFLQSELESLFGIKYTWILAGILFGLWHIPTDFWGFQFLHQKNYLYSFGQLSMQTCGGLWACAVFKKTRSIYPFIVLHWMGNNYHIHLFYTIKQAL